MIISKILTVASLSFCLLLGACGSGDDDSGGRKKKKNKDSSENVEKSSHSSSSASSQEDYEYQPPGSEYPNQQPPMRDTSFPSENQMMYDLIGHSVSEGTTNGYMSRDWTYTIENGDIEGFLVREVLTETPQEYVVVAQMNLRGSDSPTCNYYYDTTVQIRYYFDSYYGWVLDYVHCLGMEIISDKKYDYMISSYKYNNGVHNIHFRNLGECSLTVGVQILNSINEWDKELIRILPNDVESWYGRDYRIDFVLRDN